MSWLALPLMVMFPEVEVIELLTTGIWPLEACLPAIITPGAWFARPPKPWRVMEPAPEETRSDPY